MSEYTTVARIGEIPEGTGAAFAVGNKMVAVFNDGGAYYAIDDCCPHMARRWPRGSWMTESSPVPGTSGVSACATGPFVATGDSRMTVSTSGSKVKKSRSACRSEGVRR